MNLLKRLFGLKGKFDCVYVKRGEWRVKYDGKNSHDDHCEFQIHHNSVTNEYKFITLGYKPTAHSLYEEMFQLYRSVCDGDNYIRGGKICPHTNETIHKRPKQ